MSLEFGVFDHWFCEVPSQTFMNRSFWTAATCSPTPTGGTPGRRGIPQAAAAWVESMHLAPWQFLVVVNLLQPGDGMHVDPKTLDTKGIAAYDTAMALDWGVSGPGLRATGCAWDVRKARPYAGFENFDFEIPVGHNGDCYDRTCVRVEEIRQSLKIIRQCVDNMPSGPIKADHPLTTPPPRERMLRDIDTMIHHFVGMSWGPVLPAGEYTGQVETVRGLTQFALISDGEPSSYRTRIRTPSFPHLQMISAVAPGMMVADLVAYLGSIDYVMSDVDR